MKSAPLGTFLLVAAATAYAAPATQPAPDLSSPRATLLSLYTAMRAGDVDTLKSCLLFATPEEAEVFDVGVAQLAAPLRLMHAMEAKFGDAAHKPFDLTVEKSIDDMLARAKNADISIDGDTAIVAEKKMELNPNAETELSGVTLKRANNQWKVVASTFPDSGGEMPPRQLALMRSMRDAVVSACRQTITRLEKGEFHSADEAYAAYQALLQPTARAAAKTSETPATRESH